MGRSLQWNDMSRGAQHWIEGADESAQQIDLQPLLSGVRTEDEGLYVVQHGYWRDQMIKAVQKEQDQLIHVEGA